MTPLPMLLATVFLETRIFFFQNDSRVLVPQIAASILVAKKKDPVETP